VDRSIGALGPGGVTKSPLPLPGGYLVARLVRAVSPDLAAFHDVRERVLRDWQLSRRMTVVDSVDAHLRSSLQGGADLESLLVPLGGMRVSRAFGATGPIQDLSRDPAAARDSTFLARIFASKAGATLPPTATSLGTLYAIVETLTPPNPSEYAGARESLRREILDQRVEAWTARLRARAKIEIFRADLRP
jgi:hypothetical protein